MAISDRIVGVICGLAAVSCMAALAWILFEIIGGAELLSVEFLTQPPLAAGRAGGIAPMIVSSLVLVLIAWSTAFPIGVFAAMSLVYGETYNWRWIKWLDVMLDVLASAPSIVFGLFGNALFCVALGMGFSLLSGGLTLGCMILPLLVRTAQIGLRSAAQQHYAPAAALGLGQWTIAGRVLLPGAWSAIVAGMALATGRALAETTALIFTSGYVDRMPTSVFDSGRSISIHIYDLTMNVSGGDSHARASALVLIIVLLVINGTARLVLRDWLQLDGAVARKTLHRR